MSKIVYYTFNDLEKLKAELHKLMTVDRISISKEIGEAIDKGDLSENAEYHAAKEAQGLLEMKIVGLESQISYARLLDISKLDANKISIYSKVEMCNIKTNVVVVYILVPDSEANIKEKKISVSSPIGQGLLGKKVNEIANIQTPSGVIEFKILNIAMSA